VDPRGSPTLSRLEAMCDLFLTSALYGGELLASQSGRYPFRHAPSECGGEGKYLCVNDGWDGACVQ